MIIEVSNVLKVDLKDQFLLEVIINELTIDNPVYNKNKKYGVSLRGIPQCIKSLRYSPDGYYIFPRGYLERLCTLLTEYGIKFSIIDKRAINPFTKEYTHNISLRDYQIPALYNIVSTTNGVLEAPAGSGKTIIGICMILACKQKCLWIVHTKQLLFQFIDRLKDKTSITDDDIGLIYEGKWDYSKPITVGLIQTLRTDYTKLEEIGNNFGLVIVDEAHHVPSYTFTEVISRLNPYYMYGLTATPFRSDGLEPLLFKYVGDIKYKIERSNLQHSIITPKVLVKHLNTPNIPDEAPYHSIIKAIVTSEFRNNIIVSDVIREANLKNICIVVTERVSHANLLYLKLKQFNDKVGVITGKNSKKERTSVLDLLYNKQLDILVCTSPLLGEGFDYPPLNRLFLAQPSRDPNKCEQLVGRVQRTSPGKVDAIIFDYVDNHGLTKHQFKNYNNSNCRYNVYEKLGCTIEM